MGDETLLTEEDKGLIDSVTRNEELNDKQRLFCLHYIKCFNATKAYQRVYGCSYNTAMVEGSGHLRNPKIKAEINRLKRYRMSEALVTEQDIFKKMVDVAFSDITDYIEFGQEEVGALDSEGDPVVRDGEEVTYIKNYVRFKDSNQVDGSLISELSIGKDGAKVKLLDKMKALEWLGKHCGVMSSMDKARLELERLKVERMGIELERAKSGADGDEADLWVEAIIEIARKRRDEPT